MTNTISKTTNDTPQQILNSEIRLRDIVKTIPKECFQKNPRRAWSSALMSVVAAAVGYGAILYSPWFLLPLAWILTGTALTGWFVIAHDCGHRSFAKKPWVNDVVGHLFLLPLIYPFHSWRVLHNIHHQHTNKLMVDNAWHPWLIEEYEEAPKLLRLITSLIYGRFWWLGSIMHWARYHFNPSLVVPREQKKMQLSIAITAGFALIFFPTLFLTTGIWGVIKFWLMPWLVYHFWMSTFTLVHHTDTDIQFRPESTWNEVEAQLSGTVHCTYPRWVEFLCHDINVHIPHHLSVAIPSYNLRLAHKSLTENWGDYLKERQFSWGMMKEIVDQCHLYDPEVAYVSYDTHQQRKGKGRV
ncbi:Delta-12 acyl-phospholipid desaturase [Halothece sp. PCC 7418]|uniref:fatty acid desaturase n=1 Tax=Halothece sp. (strain PCC 7418) TaxID=65093 RepID=UPI0002A05E6D|nr:fatty acid desaturase [Halothece sp. PCC 7418]AFZ45515.1 Delta-12 acyl-phospholipid desaturase [Halothece sp. PCC 7418]